MAKVEDNSDASVQTYQQVAVLAHVDDSCIASKGICGIFELQGNNIYNKLGRTQV